MAHKGKHFPVLLRRDFIWNSDISQFPIAAAYDVQILGNFGGPGPSPAGQHFICEQITDAAVSPVTFRSDVVHDAGHDWRLDVELRFDSLPTDSKLATYKLTRLDLGVVSIFVRADPSSRVPIPPLLGNHTTLSWANPPYASNPHFDWSSAVAVGYP